MSKTAKYLVQIKQFHEKALFKKVRCLQTMKRSAGEERERQLEVFRTGEGRGKYRFLGLWGPPLAQMALIFYFSHQPAGSPVLESFPLTSVLGHLGGYALLALLLYRALTGGWRRWVPRAAVLTFVITVVYGISDEIHQYFVPGRDPSVIDILVDGAGAAAALILIRLGNIWQVGNRENSCHPKKQ